MTLNRAEAACANAGRPCDCGCADRAPRYPTDLTDGQWAVLEPLLPVALCGTPLGGRPEKHRRRTMIDAMLYVVDNGIKWRALPADFPPWQTVYGMLARWRRDGVLALVRDRLRRRARTAAGRDPQPSAAVIDSQSVHASAEGVVPATTSGYDGNKKVDGRKRHVMTDTSGLLLDVAVSAASVQDRDGAVVMLARARRRGLTRLALAWADSAYNGDAWQDWARRGLGIEVRVVPHDPGATGFRVLPRRWVVERTHAWITRRRRCARDYERLPQTHAAVVNLAAALQMTRLIAKTQPHNPAPA